jgi:hypothetical protein
MKGNNLTTYLDYMTDGYVEWAKNKCRRRRRRDKIIVAIAIFFAVAVNTTAFAIPMRYSTYSGSYGPDAVPVVDYLVHRQ